MKKFVFLTTLLITSNAYSYALRKFDRSPKGHLHLRRSIYKYKKEDLISNLRTFIKETRPTRAIGTNGHKESQRFIYDHIKKSTTGEKEVVVFQEFSPEVDKSIKMYQNDLKKVNENKPQFKKEDIDKWTHFTKSRVEHLKSITHIRGKNIVWEKKGIENPQEVIIIGAHYDSIAYDKKVLEVLPKVHAPGADNNGSGVAIALSLIEVLSELNLKRTVRVVFFDYQELGFLGSYHYTKTLLNEIKNGLKVFSYIDLLMLGNDTKLKDKEKRYGNMKAYFSPSDSTMHELDKSAMTTFLELGNKAKTAVRFTPLARDFQNGDSVSFVNAKIPSFTLTQNWESDFNANRIHSPKDYVETLNFKTLYEAFLFTSYATAAWALGI
jgi:hypothetical protein